MYQDGLRHTYQRYLHNRRGTYYQSYYIRNSIKSYDIKEKELFQNKNYIDYVYCHGYLNGLISFLLKKNELEFFPLFYLPKEDLSIHTKKEYLEVLKQNIVPKKYLKLASNIIKSNAADIVLEHRPEL